MKKLFDYYTDGSQVIRNDGGKKSIKSKHGEPSEAKKEKFVWFSAKIGLSLPVK